MCVTNLLHIGPTVAHASKIETNALSQGGPITQVEQEEMPRLLKEAQADAKMLGVKLRTRMVTMEYADFLEEY